MESIPPKIVQDRAIPLHQEPRQTGVTAWPESQGEPLVAGLWPRDKKKKNKTGKPRPQGQPGLAWPQLVRVKSGKAWQGKAEPFGLQLTCTGRGWPGLKIGQACLVTSASLARIKLQGLHTCSGFTLSGQSYRILSFIIDHQMYSKHILS